MIVFDYQARTHGYFSLSSAPPVMSMSPKWDSFQRERSRVVPSGAIAATVQRHTRTRVFAPLRACGGHASSMNTPPRKAEMHRQAVDSRNLHHIYRYAGGLVTRKFVTFSGQPYMEVQLCCMPTSSVPRGAYPTGRGRPTILDPELRTMNRGAEALSEDDVRGFARACLVVLRVFKGVSSSS